MVRRRKPVGWEVRGAGAESEVAGGGAARGGVAGQGVKWGTPSSGWREPLLFVKRGVDGKVAGAAVGVGTEVERMGACGPPCEGAGAALGGRQAAAGVQGVAWGSWVDARVGRVGWGSRIRRRPGPGSLGFGGNTAVRLGNWGSWARSS
ncbi:hypothetical protein GCM10018773_52490 [Streptomyces candidus]|nr:hypothetical protein GCM10018773_52490 [Streptomyces candidus]